MIKYLKKKKDVVKKMEQVCNGKCSLIKTFHGNVPKCNAFIRKKVNESFAVILTYKNASFQLKFDQCNFKIN